MKFVTLGELPIDRCCDAVTRAPIYDPRMRNDDGTGALLVPSNTLVLYEHVLACEEAGIETMLVELGYLGVMREGEQFALKIHRSRTSGWYTLVSMDDMERPVCRESEFFRTYAQAYEALITYGWMQRLP